MPTFVFNDETVVNTYGFRVRNNGGSFNRFDANPVMLNTHINSTEMTLGNWNNRRVEGFQLKGDPNFDNARDTVKEVSGQVERGFIKGCSMGLSATFDDDSWQKAPDGVWELVKWELMEVSICPVPSNAAAVQLYSKDGAALSTDAFKTNMIRLSNGTFNPSLQHINNPSMNFSYVLTPDDFEKLSEERKIEFTTNHNQAYKALWNNNKNTTLSKASKAYLNHPPASPTAVQNIYDMQSSRFDSQSLNYQPESIKTIDNFLALNDRCKSDFRSNHYAAYMAAIEVKY